MALKGAAVRMLAPISQGIAPNPTERSPLMSKNGKHVPMILTNGDALLPPIKSPTPNGAAHAINGSNGLKLTTQRIKKVPHRPRPRVHGRSKIIPRSIASTDIDAESTTSSRSRKRKLEDRTLHRPKTRTTNGISNSIENDTDPTPNFRRTSTNAPSSRSASVASGPRKLSRISSVAKQGNGVRGRMSVDSRKDTSSNASRSAKGPPRKLALSHRSEKVHSDKVSTQ